MSKLHDIFHNKTPTINRSQAVKDLIQRENLNINEQDENGNTILHLMVQYMFDNYYNPFIKGPFFINGANYKGPGFIDDLEFFLSIGANPSLKNNNQLNPVEMLLGDPPKYSRLSIEGLNSYLTIMQKYYPDSSLLIMLIEHGAYISLQGPRKEGRVDGVSYYNGSWINEMLLEEIEETNLPLDCLTALIKWIKNDGLKNLQAEEKIITEIYDRLVKQVNAQTQGPFLLDGVERLLNAPRVIILRGMLLNDLACPIFSFVQSLNELNLVDLLTKELNSGFEALLIEYSDKQTLLNEIDAHTNPLTEEELKVLKPISETLDNMLYGSLQQEACRDFNWRSNSCWPQTYMGTRLTLFRENSTHYQNVIEALKDRYSSIQI